MACCSCVAAPRSPKNAIRIPIESSITKSHSKDIESALDNPMFASRHYSRFLEWSDLVGYFPAELPAFSNRHRRPTALRQAARHTAAGKVRTDDRDRSLPNQGAAPGTPQNYLEARNANTSFGKDRARTLVAGLDIPDRRIIYGCHRKRSDRGYGEYSRHPPGSNGGDRSTRLGYANRHCDRGKAQNNQRGRRPLQLSEHSDRRL